MARAGVRGGLIDLNRKRSRPPIPAIYAGLAENAPVPLRFFLKEQIAQDTRLSTDEASVYTTVGKHFASHGTVNHHAKENARGGIHTNTIESYFAIVKRGLYGTFHHVSAKHLRRYMGEFDFRYNHRASQGIGDRERMVAMLQGIAGKRLTYGGVSSRAGDLGASYRARNGAICWP